MGQDLYRENMKTPFDKLVEEVAVLKDFLRHQTSRISDLQDEIKNLRENISAIHKMLSSHILK